MSALEVIGALSLGAITYGSLIAFLWHSARKNKGQQPAFESDPYELTRRREQRERTERRQAIVPLQGHHRVGLGVDPTRRRA